MPERDILLPPGQRPPPLEMRMQQLREQLAAMTQRAEAAEAKLATAEKTAQYWRNQYERNTTEAYNARISEALRNWTPDPFAPPSQEAQP